MLQRCALVVAVGCVSADWVPARQHLQQLASSMQTTPHDGQQRLSSNANRIQHMNTSDESPVYPIEPLLDVDYILDSDNYLEKHLNAQDLVPESHRAMAEQMIDPSRSEPVSQSAVQEAPLASMAGALREETEARMADQPNQQPESVEASAASAWASEAQEPETSEQEVDSSYPIEPLMDVDYVLDSHNYLERHIDAAGLVPESQSTLAEQLIEPEEVDKTVGQADATLSEAIAARVKSQNERPRNGQVADELRGRVATLKQQVKDALVRLDESSGLNTTA